MSKGPLQIKFLGRLIVLQTELLSSRTYSFSQKDCLQGVDIEIIEVIKRIYVTCIMSREPLNGLDWKELSKLI